MKPKEGPRKLKVFNNPSIIHDAFWKGSCVRARVEVHHSVGLFDLVECDGSRYGRPIKRVRKKWAARCY